MRKKWLIAIMATAMVFVLGLSVGCVDNGGTSSPSDSSSVITGKITLNYTSAKVDVYDTLQLTATKENVTGNVQWTSSDPSVATVDNNGLVSALSVGSTVVTAMVGEVEASCTITAAISEISPVMQVSTQTVPVKKGESYEVIVSTTWKGKALGNVEYAWYLEDDSKQQSEWISLNVSQDGTTATFTALDVGTETYCVSAIVNGIPLMETIIVTAVENDIYFDVTNLVAGAQGYVANVSLLGEGGHVSSFTPSVKVYEGGVEQTGVSLVWENSDDTVATMDAQGKITGLKAGTAVFSTQATVGGKTAPFKITVNVYAPEFIYEIENSQGIDLNGAEIATINVNAVSNNVKGTLTGIEVDGVKFATKAYNAGVLSFDIHTIGNNYGDKTITATFERKNGDVIVSMEKIIIPVEVYRSISTAEQLNKLVDYVQMDGTDAYGDFRMTADIDMKGETLVGVGTYVKVGTTWTPNYCWKGTFDGQGHTISNAVESGANSGLFCYIASGGVVRNVKFVDATVSGDTGLIATTSDGLVENVFVYGQFLNIAGGKGIPASMLVAKNEGVINECFVLVDYNSLTAYGGMLTGSNNGTVTDCVAINISLGWLYGVGSVDIGSIKSAGEGGIAGVFGKSYQSFADYYADKDNYTYDDWAQETLNKVIQDNIGAKLNVSQIAKNSTAKISLHNYKFVTDVAVNGTGVSAKTNGTISVDNTAIVGANCSVTVTFAGGSTKTFSFTVAKGIIMVKEQARLDVRRESVVVDLTKYGETGSSLTSVTFGTKTLSGVTLTNGKLTIPSSVLGQGKDDWGEITLTVKTADETYEVPVFVFVSVSKISDLEDMINYAYAGGMSIDGVGQDRYAYIQLTQDIDLMLYSFVSVGGVWSSTYKAWTMRFAGTFDGNGYAIKNWYPCVGLSNTTGSAWNKGLFACISEEGVVKNVAFTNTTIHGSSLIATENRGLVENVFIEGKMLTGGAANIPVGMVVGKNSGTVKNCVVICTEAPDPTTSYGAMITGRGGKTTGCVAINVSDELVYAVGKDNGSGNSSLLVSEAYEMADATNTVCHTWADYDDVKDTITTDDWAEAYIENARNK